MSEQCLWEFFTFRALSPSVFLSSELLTAHGRESGNEIKNNGF